MSAPAMKPLSLPERMTSPLGGALESSRRTARSSSNTSTENVLVAVAALSKTSHAMPSASRSIVQCLRLSFGAMSVTEGPPRLRLTPLRCPQTRGRNSRLGAALRRSCAFHQHRAAQAAADADRGNPALGLGALEHVEHVEHDPRPRRADRMPERDRPAVDVELRLIEGAQRAFEAQLRLAIRVVRP